ncbi:Protein LKAAEAR1 [Geodia barretti]|uniref:Protein LKAAEAR1 n=1 Tax=Geodia barretti TaxID=519541 RepID=A0AA35W3L5_GEOBA|nr:Protein LKAAEAR1 [Geodia barretti]
MSIYTVAVFYPSETNVFLFQYEPPSKEVQEKQMESVKRVRERQAQQRTAQQEQLSLGKLVELEKDSELIGQIKAAEARHRIKSLRECYEKQQDEELQWLINSQPTSLEAVRLKTLLRPHPPDHAHSTSIMDPLSHTQRKRCEILIEDDTRIT